MTRLVPLGDIRLEHPNWVNPREFTGLTDKELDELAADIKAVRGGDKETSGIIDPPKVVKVKSNGSYITLAIDGQRRVLAGTRVLPKSTPIEVVDLEDEPIELTPEKADELMLKALRMFNREGLSSYELSSVAERMRTRDRPLADIANAIHKSESWVSRMLKARSTASPKLMLAWKKGEITDEQFKDLASQRDASKQEEDTESVVEARKSGNKAEARQTTKEIVETAKQKKAREKREKAEAKAEAKRQKAEAKERAKQEKAAKKAAKNGKAAPAPVVTGEQQEMWTPPAEKPKKAPTPSKVSLEEIVALAESRPPTHDVVKGIVLGIKHTLGQIEPDQFGKAWNAWISRVGGATATKPAKVPKKIAKATKRHDHEKKIARSLSKVPKKAKAKKATKAPSRRKR